MDFLFSEFIIYRWNKIFIWGGLSIKENRLYSRIHFTERVKFGYDKPVYNGMSVDFSPDGMNIVSDEALVSLSNIIINIYYKKINVSYAEKLEIITVRGEVAWVKHLQDAPPVMGIRFMEFNEELARIYQTMKPRSK